MRIKVVFAISAWLVPFLIGMFFMYYVQQPAIAPSEEELQLAQMQAMQEIARTEQEIAEEEKLHEIAAAQAETAMQQEIATRNQKVRNAMLMQDIISVAIIATGIAIALFVAWNCIVWLKIASSRSRTMRTVVDASSMALVARASQPPQLQTLHYKPSSTSNQHALPEPISDNATVTISKPVPSFSELMQEGVISENLNGFLFGRDIESGQWVIKKFGRMNSILMCGVANMGKTVTLTNLVCEAALQGFGLLISDPHGGIGPRGEFTKPDCLRSRLAPLEQIYMQSVAVKADEIQEQAEFIHNELKARREGCKSSDRKLLWIIDELNSALRTSAKDTLREVLAAVNQEGRGFMIYAITICHSPKNETLGTEARDTFPMLLTHRLKRKASTTLLGLESDDAKKIAKLGVGQAFFDDGLTSCLIEIPFIDESTLELVAQKVTQRAKQSNRPLLQEKPVLRSDLEHNQANVTPRNNGTVTGNSTVTVTTSSDVTALSDQAKVFQILDMLDESEVGPRIYDHLAATFNIKRSSVKTYVSRWRAKKERIDK